MKDDFGQDRRSVNTREVLIGVLFVVVTGIAVWSVALPALDQDAAQDPDIAEAEPDNTVPNDTPNDTPPPVPNTP